MSLLKRFVIEIGIVLTVIVVMISTIQAVKATDRQSEKPFSIEKLIESQDSNQDSKSLAVCKEAEYKNEIVIDVVFINNEIKGKIIVNSVRNPQNAWFKADSKLTVEVGDMKIDLKDSLERKEIYLYAGNIIRIIPVQVSSPLTVYYIFVTQQLNNGNFQIKKAILEI